MRYIQIGLILMISLVLVACGSKRGPTGGEQDLDKPSVLTTAPAELGDISSGIIEIDFSKPMDRASLPNAIYFYPPITERMITLTRQTLRIEIGEALLPDTFYYVTLSTRLKDTRGNALDKAQTLVFSSGEPRRAQLSGIISYELNEDMGKPINLSLFSADSVLVMMKEISGSSFELANLNPAAYQLRAYIDKNLNGRYDQTAEPFFESGFTAQERTTLDLAMAYSDTTWAQLRQIRQHSKHELEVTLSEPIRSYTHLSIRTVDGDKPLEILHQHLTGDKLLLLTAAPDSARYIMQMNNLEDLKGNISPGTSLQFDAQTGADETAPRLVASNPRNGATVNSLRPELELQFSEIITTPNLSLKLIETDSKREVQFIVREVQGRTARLLPTQDLANYRSHTLIIQKATRDYSGNTLDTDIEILFLPISRR